MKSLIKMSLAVGAAVAIGACSQAADSDRAEDIREQSQAEITLDQAKQTAEAAHEGTAIGIDLDDEDGSLAYEVEFVDADVFVDAINGEILKTEAEDDQADREKPLQYQSLATVTLDQAKQTAEAAQSDTAISIDLDEEDGSLVYEVEFVDADVFVDAGNNEILGTELEGGNTETPIQGSIQVPAS